MVRTDEDTIPTEAGWSFQCLNRFSVKSHLWRKYETSLSASRQTEVRSADPVRAPAIARDHGSNNRSPRNHRSRDEPIGCSIRCRYRYDNLPPVHQIPQSRISGLIFCISGVHGRSLRRRRVSFSRIPRPHHRRGVRGLLSVYGMSWLLGNH